MNFIEAIKLLNKGQKLRRPDWLSSNYIGCDSDYIFKYRAGLNAIRIMDFGSYNPSPKDILATDWEVYKEKPKTYNFQEAFKALNEGKIIQRMSSLYRFKLYKGDPHNTILKEIPGALKEYSLDDEEMFSYEAIKATDWIIVDVPNNESS